jgi:ketosteroid isomerase-like protein
MNDKGKFLRKFNQAFAGNDLNFIEKNITDDIIWVIAGDRIIKGKENFIQTYRAMNDGKSFEISIDNVITHGSTAAVDGTMKTTLRKDESHTWAFCDIYSLSGFRNPKIKKITSYVIRVKP